MKHLIVVPVGCERSHWRSPGRKNCHGGLLNRRNMSPITHRRLASLPVRLWLLLACALNTNAPAGQGCAVIMADKPRDKEHKGNLIHDIYLT
ncbi:hypothetical protein CHARACLAT_014930 [Characodon lateralis]|uniref:Uncharacterized protein n=1 Tax=Characodon lateralis TaxID=208331 RepID=A0ABU7DRM6_9TELE|nr:hypothetical protein [Characodon lateralis]